MGSSFSRETSRSHRRRSHARRSRTQAAYRFQDGTPLPMQPLSLDRNMPRVREVRPRNGKSFSERILKGIPSQNFRSPRRRTKVGGHYSFELESKSGYPEVKTGSLFREALRPEILRPGRSTSERVPRRLKPSSSKYESRPDTWPYKFVPIHPYYTSREPYSDCHVEQPQIMRRFTSPPPTYYRRKPKVAFQLPPNFVTHPSYHHTSPAVLRKVHGVENMARAARRPKLKLRIPR